MSTNRQLAKENVVHIFDGIFSATKNKEILPFVIALMDLETIVLTEVNLTEKDKYLSYMWNLRNTINKQNRES